MIIIHRPTETEIMAEAWRLLRERATNAAPHPTVAPPVLRDRRVPCPERRMRSLRACHTPADTDPPRPAPHSHSAAYVPQLSARLDDDPNLTDGTRRCARKLAEITYQQNREGRSADITVTYLMKALRRCRRSVQRYLRALERNGYIRVAVAAGTRSRMCVGLVIDLLAPLFPRHHRDRWPARRRNSGATPLSQNKAYRHPVGPAKRLLPRDAWALRCMDGVFRALMKTIPPLPPLPASTT